MARPTRAKSALGGTNAADPITVPPTITADAEQIHTPTPVPPGPITAAPATETTNTTAGAPAPRAKRTPRSDTDPATPKRGVPVGKARASAYLTDRQATGMVDAWWTDRVLDPANAPRTRVDWLARALREYAALTTAQRTTFAAAMPLREDADEAKTPRTWNVDANARAAVDETEQIDTANQRITSPTAFVKEAILYGYQNTAKRNGGTVLTAPKK